MPQTPTDITILDLELFDAAFAIAPGQEDATRRRFMTLFVHEGHTRRGGSADVCKATNAMGETFALKRLHAASGRPSGSEPKSGQGASGARKQLRSSLGSGPAAGSGAAGALGSGSGASRAAGGSGTPGSASPVPDYVTQGHVAAFYEEYRIHLALSNLRGFPRLYGFGLADGSPVIVMEWVEGTTLRDAMRARAQGASGEASVLGASRGPAATERTAATSTGTTPVPNATTIAAAAGSPTLALLLPLERIADLGIAVLALLERAGELDERFIHRDISPRNIMLRSDRTPVAEQLATGAFDPCLLDFGSATMFGDAAADPTFTKQAGVVRMGTPAYAPPEMLSPDVALPADYRRSPSIDVYALCSVLYELYAGRKPFRIGPDTPPAYRVKTESLPEPLAPREPDGGALAAAILTGLSAQQEDRPSVSELKAALENWKALPSSATIGNLRGAKPADVGFWQPGYAKRAISRRRFIAGGIVAAAALVAGGIVGSRLLQGTSAPAANYALVPVLSGGLPLYKAFDKDSNGWVLCTAEGVIACKPASSREVGPMREGLAALYDDASGRYGFITQADNADGYGWAIQPAYAQVGEFSEGLAAAQDVRTKRWGYINVTGAWAIEPAFRAAEAFGNGAAAVLPEGSSLWGAIDPAGEWVLQPQFATLGTRSESGHAVAVDPQAHHAKAWGIVDASGAWTSDARFQLLRRFASGLAPALDSAFGRWGFVDASGAWVIEPTFMDARPFSEGLAAVQDVKTQLWYFIEPDGTPHDGMKPQFWNLGDLHDALAPAQARIDDDTLAFDVNDPDTSTADVGKRYGYVNAAGEWQMKRLANLTDTAIGSPGI